MTGFSISFLVKVKITDQFFSIQNNIFICEIYTGFPMPMMLPSPSGLCCFNFVQHVRVCNLSTCGFMRVLHGAFRRCCPTKKKSIICQQVQHNFEQYITRLKKKIKTRSKRKKQQQLLNLEMCKVDGNLKKKPQLFILKIYKVDGNLSLHADTDQG